MSNMELTKTFCEPTMDIEKKYITENGILTVLYVDPNKRVFNCNGFSVRVNHDYIGHKLLENMLYIIVKNNKNVDEVWVYNLDINKGFIKVGVIRLEYKCVSVFKFNNDRICIMHNEHGNYKDRDEEYGQVEKYTNNDGSVYYGKSFTPSQQLNHVKILGEDGFNVIHEINKTKFTVKKDIIVTYEGNIVNVYNKNICICTMNDGSKVLKVYFIGNKLYIKRERLTDMYSFEVDPFKTSETPEIPETSISDETPETPETPETSISDEKIEEKKCIKCDKIMKISDIKFVYRPCMHINICEGCAKKYPTFCPCTTYDGYIEQPSCYDRFLVRN